MSIKYYPSKATGTTRRAYIYTPPNYERSNTRLPVAYAYPWHAGEAGDKQRADFEKDLLTDLIPFVQSNYRVAADREHRALAGLSMKLFWIGVGTEDGAMAGAKRASDFLTSAGIKHTYTTTPGAHT